MQFKKRFLWIAVLGVVAVSGLSTSKLSAASIKAALTEIVLPSHPFFATFPVNSVTGSIAVGPELGTLGVTSIIVTNLTASRQRIDIFQPTMSPNAADCGGPLQGTSGPGSIFMVVNLEPNQTLSLPFPSPLVLTPINGHSCIAVIAPLFTVEAYVTGLVN